MAAGAAVLLGGVVVAVGAPATGPASAALGGLTAFAIDGNTAGPNDWDELPPNLLEHATTVDVCGSGLLDPDQLNGKLDALDLDAPNPTPGNVVNKGDLCQVWRAVEAVPSVSGTGGLDVILYGAWERYFGNGEITGYWPLVGPAPGKSDDYLIAFEFESQGGSRVELLTWSGATWVSAGPLDPAVFDVALDDASRPLFGEFALNLSAAGIWGPGGPGDCTAYASDFVFSRTGNSQNAELQDYVGLAPSPLTPCGDLVVTKVTTPKEPDPAVSFGYTVAREGGGDVQAGVPEVTGDLTVPDAPSDTISPVIAATDYTLTEDPLPTGWTLDSIVCTAFDPTTGDETDFTLTDGGTFPVTPGATTECVIANIGPASLTIVKETDPTGGTGFDFTTTSAAVPSFTLDDGGSQPIPVTAGDQVSITEALPADWDIESISCAGAADWTADPASATATVTVGPGEDITCTFRNAQLQTEPTQALLVVQKVVDEPDGTGFDFAVSGPSADPASFTLNPPDDDIQVITVTPDQTGSAYTVTETIPAGWELTEAACFSAAGETPGDRDTGSAQITLAPGEIAFCTFVNAAVPPPARLTITKETQPTGGTEFPFVTEGLDPSSFMLDDGDSQGFEGLEAGEYQVTEEVPAGWRVSGSCSDDTPVRGGRVDVVLEPGDDVTCTFVNTQQVSLTVTKVAQPQSAQPFPFTVALNKMAPVPFTLNDDGDETDDPDNGQFVSSITGPALPPGIYTIAETSVAGWTLSSLVCTGGKEPQTDPSTGVAIVQLSAGQSAECVYTNVQDVTPTPTPTPTPAPTPSPSASVGGADLSNTGTPGWLGNALLAGLAALFAGSLLLWATRPRSG